MSDFVIAGSGIALFALMFTETPFMCLVYFLAVQLCIDWSQWSVVTGLFFLSLLGGALVKGLRK